MALVKFERRELIELSSSGRHIRRLSSAASFPYLEVDKFTLGWLARCIGWAGLTGVHTNKYYASYWRGREKKFNDVFI